MRILIVEDEQELCDTMAEGLTLEGYAVDKCYDGQTAFEQISVENYDLILLDLHLPMIDGLELLAQIRQFNHEVKILIVSARASIDDRVLGLDSGANDYLIKPFAFLELEARIRNLLRRSFTQIQPLLTCGPIHFDSIKRTVTVNDEQLKLTKKEVALLEYLLLNQHKVVSQEELMEHVWNADVNLFSNAVRVHIASLRKKLKLALGYDPLVTKIGEGYWISAEVTR